MSKIIVKNPIVDLDGDELTRVVWQEIKEELIFPFLDLPTEYFDLSIQSREATDDQITTDAGNAIKEYNVGIKCATITATKDRQKEFNLSKIYPSPNATIRKILDGTIIREPIVAQNIPALIPHWNKPIIIARHSFGDIYSADEELKKAPENSAKEIDSKGIASKGIEVFSTIHNNQSSIETFANLVFDFALTKKLPVYLSTKNTISKIYDQLFVDTFKEVFSKNYQEKFKTLDLEYHHLLIDSMVTYALRSEGGFIWALKNYDGDVMSDLVAQGFGSLGMMSSYLLSSDQKTIETEAAHGTATDLYRDFQNGSKNLLNPTASIFAWANGLEHRAKLDQNSELLQFSNRLKQETINLIQSDFYTKDLADLKNDPVYVTCEEFINRLKNRL